MVTSLSVERHGLDWEIFSFLLGKVLLGVAKEEISHP